jgi:hypothetical protein
LNYYDFENDVALFSLLNSRPSSQSPALDGPPVQVCHTERVTGVAYLYDVLMQRLTRVIADSLDTTEGPDLQVRFALEEL